MRKVGGIEGFHVQLNESLSLLLGDLKAPMDLDQIRKPEFSGEPIGTSERLGSEGGQVVDVLGLSSPEERLQQRILKDTAVESVLKIV